MTRNALNCRQICFILIMYNAATKLFLYPAFMAAQMGSALLLPALCDLALQTAIVWATAFLSSRTDKTFYELLSSAFGKWAAKGVYVLLGLYFLFCAVVPLVEQRNFIHDAFYETVLSLGMFLPLFAFLFYAGLKPLKSAGAFADICMPIFVVSLVAIWAMSAGQGDYTQFLPLFDTTPTTFGKGVLSSFYRFSESAFMLVFVGNFKYKKGDALKLTLSYVAGGLAVIVTMAIFYAVYGPLARTRTFALVNSSLFFSPLDYLGRIDLFAAYAFDLVALFALALHIQAFTACMAQVFGRQDRNFVFSAVATLLLLAAVIAVRNSYSVLQQVAAAWFFIPVAAFSYLLPLSAWFVRKGRQPHEKRRGGRA